MPMPFRYDAGDYPYAYQGQEKDTETGMEAFELRLWDARIGRWLTTDPAGQYHSPYLGMGNNPISQIDPDGGQSGPGCTICPGSAFHQFISTITVAVDGSLGFGLNRNPYGENLLNEIIVTSSKPSKAGLFMSSFSLVLAKGADILDGRINEYSLFRDHFKNPFNSNKTLFSLPKGATKKAAIGFKGLGYLMSGYNLLSTEDSYSDGLISVEDRYYSHSLNVIGTLLPGFGVGLGAGDYLGRRYHAEIAQEISTEGTVTVSALSNMLKVMGIPPSKEIGDEWNSNGKSSLFNRF